MLSIDGERLLADLRHLRSFGACGTGVVRQAFSPVDMDARRWLAARMAEAGLESTIDGVGNVFGRAPAPGPALLLLGSHTDTQPRGGWLDGAMGVIYGLEVARALRESPETRSLAVDVASWMDEEGTYFSMLGSRSFCGEVGAEQLERAADRHGRRLVDAIREAGLGEVPAVRLEPGRYLGYMEAHIEQGPVLEAEGKRLGVVVAIVGVRDFTVEFEGMPNHAGTTPMPLRRDAGAACIELAYRIQSEFRELAGPRTVWTIGDVRFDPGTESIIPGRAEMLVQFRDPEGERLDRLEAHLRRRVAEANERGPVRVTLRPADDPVRPTPMDETLQGHLAQAAEVHAPGAWIRMPSAAAHDAQIFGWHLPTAMLFVPSIGGISHDFAEDTREEDIVLGCQVFGDAVLSRLREARG